MEAIEYIIITVIILMSPGHLCSYLIFENKTLDFLERAGISFIISVSFIPLLAFYLNLIGLPLTKHTIIFQNLLIIITLTVILIFKKRKTIIENIKRKKI